MLSAFENGIITLVRNSIKGEKQTPDADFDFDAAYSFAKKHQIIPLVYYGAAHIDSFVNSQAGAKFLITTMTLAGYSETQLAEIDKVSSAFKESGIEFLKLKGTVLKRLYPLPEMRLMSDADILIKTEQMPKIEGIMKNLGFAFVTNSDHEWIWQKDGFTIELHKRLIASYQKDYYEYFGNGWQLAKRNDATSEYRMSKEDELIYLFTHLAKHYRDAGIGVKHFTDIYVFLRSEGKLDMDYVQTKLEKLKLYEFFENVRKMLDVWFEEAEHDEISEFITSKIFESGVYGQRVTELKSQALKRKIQGKSNSKLSRFLTHIFPPYRTMKNMYTVLEKAPVLLPFMWAWRWIRLIFTGKKSIERYNRESKLKFSDESIDEYQCELNYVGLDFNFKE